MNKRFVKYNKYTKEFTVITYDEKKLYNYAINRISGRDYGRKELFDKMKKFQDDESIINKVLDKLEEQKYISDERRATALLNMYAKQESRNKTIKRILNLGITKETLEDVLKNIERVDIKEKDAEVLTATELLIKKFKIYNKDNWNKMTRFLASKGYSYDIIKKSLEDFKNDMQE